MGVLWGLRLWTRSAGRFRGAGAPMELLYLLAALIAADVPRLGADDWHEREAAHQRLNNPLSALFLPVRDSDLEIDRRLKELRAHNLRWCNPLWIERRTLADDPAEWARRYFLTGYSRLPTDDVFLILHSDNPRVTKLFQYMKPPCGYEGFLRPPRVTHDYFGWCRYVDYWRARMAPMPREVKPSDSKGVRDG